MIDCPICQVWDAAEVDYEDPAGANPPRDADQARATFEFVDGVGGRWHDPREPWGDG